jgi:hypothetical protein
MLRYARRLAVTALVITSAAVGQAIPYGQPDDGAHPYVGDCCSMFPTM